MTGIVRMLSWITGICLIVFGTLSSVALCAEGTIEQYGDTVVREARAWELLSEVERCALYSGSDSTSGARTEAWRKQLLGAQAALQLQKSGDWDRIDFGALSKVIDVATNDMRSELERMRGDVGKKISVAQKSDPPSEEKATTSDSCTKVTYMLRLNDYYQRTPELVEKLSYYKGGGNWKVFRPLQMDIVQPHEWLYVSLDRAGNWDSSWGSVEKKAETWKRTMAYLPENCKAIVARNRAEGYDTHVSIACDGQAMVSSTLPWIPEQWLPVLDSLTRFAEQCGSSPGLIAYDILNEAELRMDPQDLPHVERLFKQYLCEKYGEIEKLNAKVGRSYKSFDEVGLEPSAPPKEGQRPEMYLFAGSPGLRYELNDCRRRQLVKYMEAIRVALKAGDPQKPVMPMLVFDLFDSIRNFKGLDLFAVSERPWEILGIHHFNKYLPSDLQLYSYCVSRYTGHCHWNDQACFPWHHQLTDKLEGGEPDIRAAVEFDLWNDIAWGMRGFDFYVADEAWADWGNCLRFIDPEKANKVGKMVLMPLEDTPIRYSMAALPVVKEKANAVVGRLRNAEVVHPRVGILVPDSSLLVLDRPAASIEACYSALEWLMGRHYSPFFVPEEYVADGRENLSEFKFVIVPYAPYLLPKANEALTNWVKRGGVVLSVGPTGVFDPYGAKVQGLINEVLGVKEVTRQEQDRWLLDGVAESSREAALGSGRVVYAPFGDQQALTAALQKEAGPLALVAADSLVREYPAPKKRPWDETRIEKRQINDLGLVFLQGKTEKKRYLWAVNFNIHETLTPTIRVKGDYHSVTDLMVEGGALVKTGIEKGWTVFKTRLAPGQGLLFELE